MIPRLYDSIYQITLIIRNSPNVSDKIKDRDADRIRNVLNTNDSDECPLKVSGHNLCSMTENLIHCIGKPLRKLNPEERKKIITKVEPDEAKRKNLLKNDRMLTKVIVSYVKRECPEKCCSFMWA